MKISLRWLCSHISGLVWTDIDVSELTKRFNAKVAEIEHVEKVSVSLEGIQAMRYSAALAVGLPARSDVLPSTVSEAAYLVRVVAGAARWITLADMGLAKEGLVPALSIPATGKTSI